MFRPKPIYSFSLKALQIISFSEFWAYSSPLFKKWRMLKLKDIVDMQNCLLSHSFPNDELPKSFLNFFSKNVVILTIPRQDLVCLNLFICPTSEVQNTVWTPLLTLAFALGIVLHKFLDSPSKLHIGGKKKKGHLTTILIATNFLCYFMMIAALLHWSLPPFSPLSHYLFLLVT